MRCNDDAIGRLTYEKSKSRWDVGKHPTKCTSRHTFQEVVARLAAYEDTGLEPGEVKEHEATYIETMTRTYGPFHQKISQWLQAEKDGRLVVMPYKIGDLVYQIAVRKKYLNRSMCTPYIKSVEIKTENAFKYMNDIGKTAFLTREEAEAALKKREEAENETD